MTKLKMESGNITNNINNIVGTPVTVVATSASGSTVTSLSLSSMDCYEDMFKEITKKLYGEEGLAEVIDASGVTTHQSIVYDPDAFRTDGTTTIAGAGQIALVTATPNGLPPGTIVVQRRIQDDKGRIWTFEGMPQPSDQVAISTVATTQHQQNQPPTSTTITPVIEERWFESEDILTWTTSKIARYNPSQKVFRCVDCDFVGFLSRVAEHWLGNHASLRVFQCPRCPYTSAWARCVRMHLTRQHGETLTDNSLCKENPVLEEVTKFLTGLKTRVELKNNESMAPGEKRYTCPYCPYATDRRDLFNRHENIHRDEKPFQCYVCDKQFNRADHVKKHFMRMHREHPYDINKIRKNLPKRQSQGGAVPFYNKNNNNNNNRNQQQAQQQQQQQNNQQQQDNNIMETVTTEPISLQIGGTNHTVTLQQIPHIAYFNPPSTPGQTGPLQGIQGVGGTKKESKPKGTKKKKSGEKMYTCSYCPWTGVDNWCLKRHLNTHIKPFLCALCDYKAARSERLATHVLKVHNKRVCHKCSFLADDTETLSQHIQDSHQNPLVKTGFNCNVCQEYFELRADLEAHAILEHQKVIVQCDLCDFRTTDELSMEAHLRDKHNLQPGMGAVAAAAAAAAAAASINGHQQQQHHLQQQQNQMQINQQQQQQQQQVQMQLQEQIQIQQQQQNMIVTSNNGSSIASTSSIAATIDQVAFQIADEGVMEDDMQDLKPKVEDLMLTEIEPEPETFCTQCGIDFADESSLRNHEKRHDNSFEGKSKMMAENNRLLKSVLRSYTCSTCSYTCATRKTMMQHQRAHSGFQLECQAENCQFSTPFDNSLKEHIQTEHNDEFIRCPHCGFRMPSISGFNVHWTFHHVTLCSLCVNVYKVKYGMKENDIHDLILKTGNSSDSNEKVNFNNNNNVIQIKSEEMNGDSSNHDENQVRMDDDEAETQKTTTTNDECDSEPPHKKSRADLLPNLNAVNKFYLRQSIQFLPKLVEVKIIANKPPTSNSALQYNHQQQHINNHITTNNASKIKSDKKKKGKKQSFRKLMLLLTSKKKKRVPLYRRYTEKNSIRGIYQLYNYYCSDTYKCHSQICYHKRNRYSKKANFVLHNLWHHTKRKFPCDTCDNFYPHLYQAYLHKVTAHKTTSQQKQQVIQQQHHQQMSQPMIEI